jgi:translation elongation factor EF-G
MREKLGDDAILMQLPIGAGEKFQGIIDLVTMKAVYFDGRDGEIVREEPIPEALEDRAHDGRHQMLESLAMYSDELMELAVVGRTGARRVDSPSHPSCRAASGCDPCLLGVSISQ